MGGCEEGVGTLRSPDLRSPDLGCTEDGYLPQMAADRKENLFFFLSLSERFCVWTSMCTASAQRVPREQPFWAGELKQEDFCICISAMTSLDCEERVQKPATHHMMRVGGSELSAAWSREDPCFSRPGHMEHLSGEAKGTSLPLPESALQMSVRAVLRCRKETGRNMPCGFSVVRGAGSNPNACGQEGVIFQYSVEGSHWKQSSQWPCLPHESS